MSDSQDPGLELLLTGLRHRADHLNGHATRRAGEVDAAQCKAMHLDPHARHRATMWTRDGIPT